jgi:Fe-Mn family superoxide dismutase
VVFLDAADAAPQRQRVAHTSVGGRRPVNDDDYVTRREFRLLICYLSIYATMYELFSTVDGGSEGVTVEDDSRISRAEWAAGLGALQAAAASLTAAFAPPSYADEAATYTVPPLTYNYSALEPWIDTDTMMLHHDAHHAAYVAKLNAQTEGKPAASLLSLQATAKEAGLNNSAGGHYNHSMFWTTMGPDSGGAPTGELGAAIDKAFGSYDAFKEKWSAASAGVFGSGWAWLVVGKDGAVSIATTPNQDNPLMDKDAGIPILGIDVWEHAYYLRYKNKRPEYIAAFFSVINWPKVSEYYAMAKSGKAIEF